MTFDELFYNFMEDCENARYKFINDIFGYRQFCKMRLEQLCNRYAKEVLCESCKIKRGA